MVEYKPALPITPSQKAYSNAPPLPRILVPRDAKNLARGKPVSDDSKKINDSFENPLRKITDGDKNVFMELGEGQHWVQIDLLAPSQIYAIHLWHDYLQPYVYRDVVIQISNDENFKQGVRTVFNNSRDKKSRFGIGPNKPYTESRQRFVA